jgi:hypothetical protein
MIVAHFLFPKIAKGQQQDFQGIIGFSLEKKISPSFSVALLNQQLFNQNLTELGNAFIDAGINYKFINDISFGVNYRLIQQHSIENIYHPRQMLYADVSYSKSFQKISATARGRIQSSFYPLVIGDFKQSSVVYNRDRLTIRYRLNYYIIPFVYGEIWFPINHPTHYKIDRLRCASGFYYNFNDHFKAQVYYSITHELNQSNKKTNFATGIMCFFKL